MAEQPDRASTTTAVAPAPGSEGFRLVDLWAGLTAAAVVLPQAMAFGVALFSPLGLSPASGALGGLVGAACLCLMSGLIGGTHGLISAPTGPSLVLLAGALAAATAVGVDAGSLPGALVAITVMAGAMQLALGAAGGGRLIKFIPYPVVAGFMTGAGILMMLSQVQPLSGGGLAADWQGFGWMPVATAMVTLAITWLLPKWLPSVPGGIAGLVLGTLFFHALVAAGPGPLPAGWTIGALPGPGEMDIGLDLQRFVGLPWSSLLLSAGALALLASVNTLLAAVIADVTTGARHDSRRELMGQGVGSMLTGVLGGMTGSATTGATVLAASIGGRRWCSTVTGAAFVLLVLVGGAIGEFLPVSVLAGIVLRVALGTLELDILAWARRRRTRLDAVVALTVTVVTVAWNLIAAVGVGVAIAIVLFVRAQVMAPVVHRRSTGTQLRSLRGRSLAERDALQAHGERIVVYELRGSLFFATADRLFEELLPDLGRPLWLILNLRRVTQVDLTGLKILQQIAARVDAAGGQLLFCEVHRGAGAGHKMSKTLRKISPRNARLPIATYNGQDEALEHAEDALLSELGTPPTAASERVELADTDLCRHMRADELQALADALVHVALDAGERLFCAGEDGAELYLLVHGELEVRVPTTEHHHKRLAIYGPGAMLGEVAFLSPGARTADAIALHPCELLKLDREGFAHLSEQHPGAAIALLFALGRAEAEHLRWSAGELRRLSEW